MNWDDFDAFCQVVDHGGFTAAARALERPKSSLSASVARLEAELGTRLLERTTRQLRLTDAGDSLYRDISRPLAQLRERPRELAVQVLAGFGQAQAARGALEQAAAQLLFQPGHRNAQAGLRAIERARRRREAAVLHHLAEGVEVVPVHCSGCGTQKPAPPVDPVAAIAYDCPIQRRLLDFTGPENLCF